VTEPQPERVPEPEPADAPTSVLAQVEPAIDEEPSITGVHGTIARFEMAYDPASGEVLQFGPPARQLWPGYVYLAVTLAVAGTVASAYVTGPLTRVGVYVLEGDRDRPFPAVVLAFLLLASGIATVWRARMRGVVVHPEGLEARYLLALGVPRIRKWTWAQIDRFVLDDEGVMLELWNGEYERLPVVARQDQLNGALSSVAAARKKEVTVLSATRGARQDA
jgi:hypothetical protein